MCSGRAPWRGLVDPSTKPEVLWGRLDGVIYSRLRCGRMEILTGPSGNRKLALPIFQCEARNSGWLRWAIHGIFEHGILRSEIRSQESSVRDYEGELYREDNLIARLVARQLVSRDWNVRIHSIQGPWILHAVPVSNVESDVVFSNSDHEVFAQRIVSHQVSWRDLVGSRFGLGVLKKGFFVNGKLVDENSEDWKAAFILLLTAYLLFFEPIYNVNYAGG